MVLHLHVLGLKFGFQVGLLQFPADVHSFHSLHQLFDLVSNSVLILEPYLGRVIFDSVLQPRLFGRYTVGQNLVQKQEPKEEEGHLRDD